jgi:hypothetical protein
VCGASGNGGGILPAVEQIALFSGGDIYNTNDTGNVRKIGRQLPHQKTKPKF